MTDKDEIAQLKREVAELKASQPTKIDPDAVARHLDQVHQMRERNASAGALSTCPRDQLRDYERAVSDAQAIVRDNRGAPTGPKGMIPQQVSDVRPNVQGTGWAHTVPLRNGLGQGKG